MKSTMKYRTLPLILATMLARFDGEDLEYTVDDVAKVPEPLRTLYVKDETSGQYRLRVKGVEDVTGLKNSLAAAREDAKKAKQAAQDVVAKYKDVDPEKYFTLLKAIEEGDEQALIKSGKFEDVINRRLTKVNEQHLKELKDKDALIEAEKQRGGKWRSRVLENAIRQAASRAKLHPSAVEDAVLNAQTVFTLDDEGNAVKLDENGQPLLGKSGKPYNPSEWLEERQQDRPHWFLEGSSGGGAGGSGKGTGGARTLKRSAFEAMSAADKAKAAKEYTIVD